MNYVLYHDSCMDGFAAAYAAWVKLGDTATYIPVQYGQPIPNMPDAEDIFILDFSWPRTILESWRSDHRFRTMIVLDHHKSADEELEGLAYAHFDMTKSGCVLAWELFHPNKPIPELLLYIQDRDLWEWKLKDSKGINAYLKIAMQPLHDFVKFNLLANTDTKIYAEYSQIILRVEGQIIAQAMKHIHLVSWPNGMEVMSVNSPVMQSEIGNEIAKLHTWGDVYYHTTNEQGQRMIQHSLRSVGNFDVSKIAKRLGGGGHKNAAGFREFSI